MGRKKGGKKTQSATSPTVNLGEHNSSAAKPHSSDDEDAALEKATLEKAKQLEGKPKAKASPKEKEPSFKFDFQADTKEQEKGDKPPLFKFDFSKGADNYENPQFDFTNADEGLVKMFQKKLASIVGESSGYLESLPLQVRNRVEALKRLQEEKSSINKQLKEERAALEKKYEEQLSKLFNERAEIINGKLEPTPEQSGAKVYVVEEDEKGNAVPAKSDAEGPKGIPSFWLVVLQHHDIFSQMIQEHDEEAMTYLTNISYQPLEPEEDEENFSSDSFAIDFHFAENPFFTNKILSKKYYLKEDPVMGQVFYDHVIGTTIEWKEGKKLTVQTITKKKGKGKGRGSKTVTTEEPRPSFFNFFSDDFLSMIPEDQLDEDEEIDLEDLAEQDYEYGVELKEKIIPNAVLWFTGEVFDGQDEDFDDEYDEEFDEDDFEDEDDPEGYEGGEKGEYDEEDSDEDEGHGGPQMAQQAPDCKQQ